MNAQAKAYEAFLAAQPKVEWLEMTEEEFNAPVKESIEEVVVFVESNKKDSKGRTIGYNVGYSIVNGQVYGWVQAARNGEDFGITQRSKKYANLEEAKRTINSIAKERIANLK